MAQATNERIRLNLAITPQVKDRLDHLLKVSDAETLTEVIRRALAAYEVLLDTRRRKGRVILEDANGTKEVLRVL